MLWQIDEQEAGRLVAALISVDSVNPSLVPGGAGEQGVACCIQDYLRSVGIEAWLDEVAPGRPNVIGLVPAQASASAVHGLMLNGHLDTVGMSEPGQLHARSENGRVYGLGAMDMKGGLVMELLALAAVKRAGVPLRRSVLFTGVVDEEHASLGTEDVVRRYRADAAILTEPTGLRICVAHKGFAWATVETLGRAAHGSNYVKGIDAITKMGKVLAELDHLSSQYLSEEGHPLVGHRSVHASLIQGGKELSTYPDHCRLQVERRTLPGEDPATFLGELQDACTRLASADPNFKARATLDFTRQGYEIDRHEPIVASLGEAYRLVTGESPEYYGNSGWKDSALLGAAGIPTVIFGPDGDLGHAAGEYVCLNTIIRGARVLAETIIRTCG